MPISEHFERLDEGQKEFFLIFGQLSSKFATLEFHSRLLLEWLSTPNCVAISACLTDYFGLNQRLDAIKKITSLRYCQCQGMHFQNTQVKKTFQHKHKFGSYLSRIVFKRDKG